MELIQTWKKLLLNPNDFFKRITKQKDFPGGQMFVILNILISVGIFFISTMILESMSPVRGETGAIAYMGILIIVILIPIVLVFGMMVIAGVTKLFLRTTEFFPILNLVGYAYSCPITIFSLIIVIYLFTFGTMIPKEVGYDLLEYSLLALGGIGILCFIWGLILYLLGIRIMLKGDNSQKSIKK